MYLCKKRSLVRNGKWRLWGRDMITLWAKAHTCVEPLYGDNMVQWGVLFMLFIWLNTK